MNCACSEIVKLSPPWITYFKMIYNLLTPDKEISMPEEMDNIGGFYTFTIESSNATKIIALSKILKRKVEIGNITIAIKFRCINSTVDLFQDEEEVTAQDFEDAFAGNPLFVETQTIHTYYGNFEYAIFSRDIITFYNDNMADYKANAHFIVADIVSEVMVPDCSVMPCTVYNG